MLTRRTYQRYVAWWDVLQILPVAKYTLRAYCRHSTSILVYPARQVDARIARTTYDSIEIYIWKLLFALV